MSVTFGYKPENEKAPSWATHMIKVEEEPEIWYFARKHDGRYFVYGEDDDKLNDLHSVYTDHSIVMGGIFEIDKKPQTNKIDMPFGKLILRYQHTQPTFGDAVDGKSSLTYKIEYDGIYLVDETGFHIKVEALVLDGGETLSL